MSECFDLLKDSFSCVEFRGEQHAHVMIKEPGAEAKLNKVTINMGTGSWFSIDPDRGRGGLLKFRHFYLLVRIFHITEHVIV